VAVAENVALVKERIERALERAGRKPGDVRIVAVTKTATVETARELLQNGITHLGENRSNEFLHKSPPSEKKPCGTSSARCSQEK